MLGYIEGTRVIELAAQFQVSRGSVNHWLQWYNAQGTEGLLTGTAPGPARRLSAEQRDDLARIIDEGPVAVGYMPGVWTGPMIGDFIESRFGVRYHNHYQ